MKKYAHALPMKIAALFAMGMLTAACTDQQQRTAGDNMDRAGERTEELYNDIRMELRDARAEGRICMSSYEELREEWRDHSNTMNNARMEGVDNTRRQQTNDWNNELDDMFDDMGDIIDRNC